MKPTKWSFEKTDEQGNVTAAVHYDGLVGDEGLVRIVQGDNEIKLPTPATQILVEALQQILEIRPSQAADR